MRKFWPLIGLLCLLWISRIPQLEQFPLHNDEGLHLTRALEVWHLHPFWEISDGKIINHWLIAAFYPQHSPVFVGRIATIFVALLGLAAAYALTERLLGRLPAVLAGVLWITSPYLFLYERFAFSDAEAGALVVLTMLSSLHLSKTGRHRDAVFTGLALGTAILFKFTAAPFALMVAIIVMFIGTAAWRRRLTNLLISGVTVLACFAIPVLYLAIHGEGFGIALGWIVGSGSGQRSGFGANLGTNWERLWAQLIGFGSITWLVALIVGLGALLILSRRQIGPKLVVAAFAPLGIIMLLGSDVQPRHFVVALPLALTLAGSGLGLLITRFKGTSVRWGSAGLVSLALTGSLVAFAWVAYTDPGALPLPPLERLQYVTDHSAGFGLRAAVLALPQTVKDQRIPIIASMFPDSCRRANFYAVDGFTLMCTAAPGLDAITASLATHREVYVLAEKPPIGIDVATLLAKVTRIAAYPRPGETDATASVTLWRLDG